MSNTEFNKGNEFFVTQKSSIPSETNYITTEVTENTETPDFVIFSVFCGYK